MLQRSKLDIWIGNDIRGVLGHDSALVRLYCAGDNLGEYDEFCSESCSWRRIDRLTYWPAVQRATIVLRMPPFIWIGQDSSK